MDILSELVLGPKYYLALHIGIASIQRLVDLNLITHNLLWNRKGEAYLGEITGNVSVYFNNHPLHSLRPDGHIIHRQYYNGIFYRFKDGEFYGLGVSKKNSVISPVDLKAKIREMQFRKKHNFYYVRISGEYMIYNDKKYQIPNMCIESPEYKYTTINNFYIRSDRVVWSYFNDYFPSGSIITYKRKYKKLIKVVKAPECFETIKMVEIAKHAEIPKQLMLLELLYNPTELARRVFTSVSIK